MRLGHGICNLIFIVRRCPPLHKYIVRLFFPIKRQHVRLPLRLHRRLLHPPGRRGTHHRAAAAHQVSVVPGGRGCRRSPGAGHAALPLQDRRHASLHGQSRPHLIIDEVSNSFFIFSGCHVLKFNIFPHLSSSYIFKVRKVSLRYDIFKCFPHADGKDEEMVSGVRLMNMRGFRQSIRFFRWR